MIMAQNKTAMLYEIVNSMYPSKKGFYLFHIIKFKVMLQNLAQFENN